MRYVKLFFPLLVSLIFFSSCSPSATIEAYETENLRTTVNALEEEIIWTNQIEAYILATPVQRPENLNNDLELNPVVFNLSKITSKSSPLYPAITGFALLNLSAYDEESFNVITEFCNTFCGIETDTDSSKSEDSATPNAEENKYAKLERLMSSGKMYELVIFIHDNQKYAFESYKIGEPFKNENIFQCPVRFYDNHKIARDVVLFLEKEDNGWKISQISYL